MGDFRIRAAKSVPAIDEIHIRLVSHRFLSKIDFHCRLNPSRNPEPKIDRMFPKV